VLVLVVVGIVRCGPRWATALLAQLSWVLPLIAIMDTSYSASNRIGALQGVQGRYLFVGVAAIAATIGIAAGGRLIALLPLLALITAALGLAAGVAHFYLGNGFTGEVGTLSAWSPLRLRVLVPIAVLCAAAALAGAWLAAPRRLTEFGRVSRRDTT
jgi:hypothetical protein